MGRILLFLSLFFTHAALAGVGPPLHLFEGSPGCWDKFHGGAMTKKEIGELSVPCQNFRSDYFASTQMARTNPKKFEKKLVDTLTGAKKARAPYEAIFFAMLIHSPKLNQALAKRADVEKKLNVAFPYAMIASYRLSGKDCGTKPEYVKQVYEEMCLGSDTILPTYFRSVN